MVQEGGIFNDTQYQYRAISAARKLSIQQSFGATGEDIPIVVIDHEGLWLPEWGDLEA